MSSDDFFEKINEISKKTDSDILLYWGDIRPGSDELVIKELSKRKLRKNIILILATYGGDPDAAYRISRYLQEAYKTVKENDYSKNTENGFFTVLVCDSCKSAGTLICLGADKLIMSDRGELGPIDVQLRKQDEVGERTSGLTPMQALRCLELQASLLYKQQFLSLRFGKEVQHSTKIATEVATQLTVGLMAPIYQQIDPLKLAETERSLRIAQEYGQRLQNKNLKKGALERLLAGYPSHGFVIDRKEAKELFECVELPTEDLREVANRFEGSDLTKDLTVTFLSLEPISFEPEQEGSLVKEEEEVMA